MPDGTHFAAATALRTPLERGVPLHELERDLGDLLHDHWVEARSNVEALPLAEFNEDRDAMFALATSLATAAQALAKLTANNISASGPTQRATDLADLLDEATDGLLTPSAARVLSAAIKVRLAGGALS